MEQRRLSRLVPRCSRQLCESGRTAGRLDSSNGVEAKGIGIRNFMVGVLRFTRELFLFGCRWSLLVAALVFTLFTVGFVLGLFSSV